MESVDDSEAPCLRFSSKQDALDFARHGAEGAEDFMLSYSLDFAERYVKANLDLVFKIRSLATSGDYHLIFSAIPNWARENFRRQWSRGAHPENIDTAADYADSRNQSVFVGVTDLVECPNGLVPSLVRLEAAKEINDVRRDFLAAFFDDELKIGSAIGNGEVSRFIGEPVSRRKGSERGMVESGSQIASRVICVVSKLLGDRLRKYNLVIDPSPLVGISDLGPWFALDILLCGEFEILDACLCTHQKPLRTIEGMFEHGEGSKIHA